MEVELWVNLQRKALKEIQVAKIFEQGGTVLEYSSGVPMGRGLGGSNTPPPPEILMFWQSWAEFTVPWKIHP
jgi:hypothetical protein